MKYLVLASAALLISGCSHQAHLMKANAVSMKYRSLPAGKKLEKVLDVREEYCMKNFAKHSGQDKGLIDEVIKLAEAKHDIDFIRFADFKAKGNCIVLEGEGMRIVD